MRKNRFTTSARPVALSAALVLPWVSYPAAVQAHGNDHVDAGPAEHRESGPAIREEFTPIGSQVRLAQPVVSPAQGGLWSEVEPWPVVAVHAALLPNGKVLAWDATPDDADDDPHTTDNFTTRVTLWDPRTGLHVETNNDTDTDFF